MTVGTPLAGSKLPLSAWVRAAHMLNTLPNAVTVRDIENALGVTYKTAWHTVHKLLESVEDYRGPLKLFGKTVRAHVEPLLPKTRHTMTYWKHTRARKLAGTYKAPKVPQASGALSSLMIEQKATKAHIERTECFLAWMLR